MEIAPGVDVWRDVLEQMEFAPSQIAEPLAAMAPELFAEPTAEPGRTR